MNHYGIFIFPNTEPWFILFLPGICPDACVLLANRPFFTIFGLKCNIYEEEAGRLNGCGN